MSQSRYDASSICANYNPKDRERYLQYSVKEKRRHYAKPNKYITLDAVMPWKQHHSLIEIKRKKMTQSGERRQSQLRRQQTLQEIRVLTDVEAEWMSQRVSVWQGDITALEVDAIVNAANEKLLGGGGVDGAIHSAAGKLLKAECATLNGASAGQSKITAGYKLPAKYVIHTVGPRNGDAELLEECYASSLRLVQQHALRSVAFPCIATGVFGYPNEEAARIATKTVLDFLRLGTPSQIERIVFCVFLEKDADIYENLLYSYFANLDLAPPTPNSAVSSSSSVSALASALMRGGASRAQSNQGEQPDD